MWDTPERQAAIDEAVDIIVNSTSREERIQRLSEGKLSLLSLENLEIAAAGLFTRSEDDRWIDAVDAVFLILERAHSIPDRVRRE
jgi:hypothetical protein